LTGDFKDFAAMELDASRPFLALWEFAQLEASQVGCSVVVVVERKIEGYVDATEAILF